MEIGAELPLTFTLAGVALVEKRVVEDFCLVVGVLALAAVGAVRVLDREAARDRSVVDLIGAAANFLISVRVDALFSGVFFSHKGTKFGFVVEGEEVVVEAAEVDEPHAQLLLRVGEGAEAAEFALLAEDE